MTKIITDGIIVSFSTTRENDPEYIALLDIYKSKPTPRPGYGYRLREDLTWEEYLLLAYPDEAEQEKLAEQEVTANG